MCERCSDYGVQTVSVEVDNKEIQVCFRCLDDLNKS